MRRALFLSLVPIALACNNPASHACASAYTASSSAAAEFCTTFTASAVTATTGLPSFASACDFNTKSLSSACSCLDTAWATAGSGSGSAETTAVAATTTAAAVSTTSSVSSTSSTTLLKTTRPASSTTSSVDVPTTTAAPTTTQAVTTVAAVQTGSGSTCVVSEYASLSSAVKSCTNIVLSDFYAPPSSTIDLQSLQTGAVVTFAGTTTFGDTYDNNFDPIVVSGHDITITGAEGHVIEGNGAAYWDGEGSNGGQDKPDHFFVVKKTYNSKITNLNIMNWPVHCFSITGSQNVVFSGLVLNNTAGDEPNSASGSKAAAHNSDGFDVSSSDYITLEDIEVYNQDDCVAVTSGTQIVVDSVYCSGGHGLSIGSVGGKSNNTVDGVTFKNSQVVNSENGCRIKSNADTTGSISNIVYQNITVSGITDYGIDVQQDYLNGGATGNPTNGVTISDVTFDNVKGTATDSAYDYYILCGSDSCSGFTFTDVSITGGGETSSCNYPSSGCP
ncbi:hypothetical protein PoHVEF18_006693 [Penicillium ochrochloron]